MMMKKTLQKTLVKTNKVPQQDVLVVAIHNEFISKLSADHG